MAKKKYIPTPEKLYELFNAYKEWAKNNPYKVEDWVGAAAKPVTRLKERPMTWIGFEVFVANNEWIQDLSSYEQNRDNSYTDYLPIVRRIKKEIEQDQFEGASSGVYQQNIIARKLGLHEKVEESGSKEVTIKVKYECRGTNDNPE